MSAKEFSLHPTGDTVLLAAASVAPTGVQVISDDPEGANRHADCYNIYNSGDETVFLSWNSSASDAQSDAVIPTAGTNQKVIPVPAGAVVVYRLGLKKYFSGITASATCNVYITPGEGL